MSICLVGASRTLSTEGGIGHEVWQEALLAEASEGAGAPNGALTHQKVITIAIVMP